MIAPCRQAAVQRMKPSTAARLEKLHSTTNAKHVETSRGLDYVHAQKGLSEDSHSSSKQKIEDIDAILADSAFDNPDCEEMNALRIYLESEKANELLNQNQLNTYLSNWTTRFLEEQTQVQDLQNGLSILKSVLKDICKHGQ